MAKQKKKVIQEVEYGVYDAGTGAYVSGGKHIVRNVPYEKFVKVYLEDFSGLLDIGKGEVKVLTYCWKVSEYNTGRIFLVKKVKQEMANEVGIGADSIDNIITKLTRKKLLINEGSAVYRLNPNLFWKGDEAERAHILRVTVDYKLMPEEKEEEVKRDEEEAVSNSED